MWWLGLTATAVLIVVLLLVLLWWLQGLRRQTDAALGPDALRLQAQLLQGLQAMDMRLQQLERSSQSTQMTVAKSDGALDRVTQHVQTQLAQAQQDAQLARREQAAALTAFREEVSQLAQRLAADSQQARAALAQSSGEQTAHVQQRFEALAETTRGTLDSLKGDIQQQLTHMSTNMGASCC